MGLFWLLGGVILAAVYFLDRERLQFDVGAFKKFTKVLLIGSACSIALNVVIGRFPPLLPVSSISLLFVFWEDLAFSLLFIYYAHKYLPKWAAIPLAVISSVVFGLGHLYQGWLVVVILSFYPYFVSYKFGKKYGYGTVMVSHVFYDLIINSNIHIMHFFKGLL